MDLGIILNKFRIELNNLIQSYREKGIPPYLLSGTVSQEMLRLKEFEIADIVSGIDTKEENDDGNGTDIQSS